MISAPINEVNDAPELSGCGHMLFWNRLIVKLTTNEHRVSQIINIEKLWSPILLLIGMLREGLL
jgi:hypothetical protein